MRSGKPHRIGTHDSGPTLVPAGEDLDIDDGRVLRHQFTKIA